MKWFDNLRLLFGPLLYTGITLAIFNLPESKPDEIEQLKRYANGLADNKNLRVFNNLVGMLNGPVLIY